MRILLSGMEIPILKEIVIILGLSVLIILAFQKFKIPAIIGLLITAIGKSHPGTTGTNIPPDVVIHYQDVLYHFDPPDQVLEMNRYLRL
jgi:Kef-type K+ transport system membrane component KefB